MYGIARLCICICDLAWSIVFLKCVGKGRQAFPFGQSNLCLSLPLQPFIFLMNATCLTLSHSVSLCLTWSHIVSNGFTWLRLFLLGCTWYHLDSLGFTCFHLVSLDLAWSHLASRGFTWSNVCLHLRKGEGKDSVGKREGRRESSGTAIWTSISLGVPPYARTYADKKRVPA